MTEQLEPTPEEVPDEGEVQEPATETSEDDEEVEPEDEG